MGAGRCWRGLRLTARCGSPHRRPDAGQSDGRTTSRGWRHAQWERVERPQHGHGGGGGNTDAGAQRGWSAGGAPHASRGRGRPIRSGRVGGGLRCAGRTAAGDREGRARGRSAPRRACAGHAKLDHPVGHPMHGRVRRTRPGGACQVAVRRGAVSSTVSPRRFLRGGPTGEPNSIPRAPPGRGPDPQGSRAATPA